MTDAHADADKVRSQMVGNVADAVMAAMAAAGFHPDLAQRQVQLVIDHENPGRRQFVEAHRFSDRLARSLMGWHAR